MSCELQSTPSKARTERFKVLGLKRGEQPKGQTVDASCRNPLCSAKDHVLLRAWASLKPETGKYSSLLHRLSGMDVDTYFDLTDFVHADIPRLRTALNVMSKDVRCIVRMLPAGGARLIRTGTFGCFYHGTEDVQTATRYQNLMQPPAKPSNQLGSPWLGMLWGTWDAAPGDRGGRVPACRVKACAFPSIVQGVCRQHSRFFVYRSNRDDVRIDHLDMWSRATEENPNPDPYYTTGWLTEDKSNFLNVCTEKSGVKSYRSRGEIQNDKWWKENVIDKGVDTGNVVSRKNMLYAAEQREKVQRFDAALEEISAAGSAANIRAFYAKKGAPRKKKRREEKNFFQLSRDEIREMGFSEHRFDYDGVPVNAQ